MFLCKKFKDFNRSFVLLIHIHRLQNACSWSRTKLAAPTCSSLFSFGFWAHNYCASTCDRPNPKENDVSDLMATVSRNLLGFHGVTFHMTLKCPKRI